MIGELGSISGADVLQVDYGARSQSNRSFAAELEAAGRGELVEQVRELAVQLVSTAFVQPALESVRDSGFRSERFAAGDAERRFGPLLDQHIADRVTGASEFPIVDRLTEHVLERYAKAGVGA